MEEYNNNKNITNLVIKESYGNVFDNNFGKNVLTIHLLKTNMLVIRSTNQLNSSGAVS
jgi:hypothetical protein